MKTVLLTGSSGFVGKNIIFPLERLGYIVKRLDLYDSDYCTDLSQTVPELHESFDFIIHAAGKAHSSQLDQKEGKIYFDINLNGTKNLCRGLERSGLPKAFIFISSVAVYGLDSGENISEDYPLNGTTPYAISKIQAERFLSEWCKKHRIILGIMRPSLIAGPEPPGNLGNMVKGIKKGRYFSIAGGSTRKSLVMVQDIANVIPLLVEKGGIYNICDTESITFSVLEEKIAFQIGKGNPFSIPMPIARLIAFAGDFFGEKAPINSSKLNKLTQHLTFSNYKARKELGWVPIKVVDNFMI